MKTNPLNWWKPLTLGLLAILLATASAFATANYVYHERTVNNPGCGGTYVDVLSPNASQPVNLRWKVEYQNYTTQTRVYYTTNGSAPAGAFGVASGTTTVISGTYTCTFGSPVVDVCTAQIPAQPAGTVVKYIISAWHASGGAEIFANSGEFISPFTTSGQATVFSYTVAAASGTWAAAASGNWSDTTKWSSSTIADGTSAVGTFSQTWSGQTVTLDNRTLGQITAVPASVSGSPSLLFSGGSLTLDNGVSVPVINASTFSEFTRFKIASVLKGTNGFEKQGNGYFDLSGSANTFTGTIKLTALASGGANFTVINADANLGNAANVITVALNTQPVGFYNDAAAGAFTLNSARTITTSGSGDFWVKNKSGANMTIAGVISGSARLRKNDSGTLTLTGANSFSGGTLLDGGTLVLSGGNDRLPTATTVQFNAAGTLDITSTAQSVAGIIPFGGVTSTIKGAGGSLTVTANANFTVNGADATILDMSGLNNFTYNQSTKNFVVQPATSATTANNTLNLAKAGANNITALNITAGGATGSSQGTAFEGRLGLGTANNFNTDNLNIGGFNGSGLISFQSGLTAPVLTLRGLTGGSSRVTTALIGATSSGVRSGAGILNLTGGSLDAMAGNLTLNRHIANANNGATSSLTMPAGTLDVTTIVLGDKTGTGTPTLATALNQGGGTVKVSTLTFGQDAGGGAAAIFQSSYNLSGGTLNAATIQAGTGAFSTSSARNIVWTGGTIANYDASTDLTINGVSGAGGSIIIALSTATAKAFNVDTARTITLGANTALTGSADLSKLGNGTLTLASSANTYSGNLTISAGKLALSGTGTIASTPSIGIAAGAIFDVSGITPASYTVTGSSPQQTLAASSTSGTATVNATGKPLTLALGAMVTFKANGTASTVGKISVTGDLNLNANAITVDISGAALGVGTYRLLECSGTLANSGTFGAPTITGSGLVAGKVHSLKVVTGAAGYVDLLVTTPPTVTTPILLGAQSGIKQTLLIIGSPKYAPQDADGDTLTLSAFSYTSGNGATVAINGNSVEYTALSNFTGADSFTYTVSDGKGGTAVGTVNVAVVAVSNTQQTPTITYVSGTVTVTFWGYPGTTYTIERSISPSSPWGTVGTATANDTNTQPYGKITYTETPPGSASYFYRLKP